MITLIVLLASVVLAPLARASDGRAAGGSEVVLDRMYPKAGSVEVEATYGFLLNPTYVDTTLARAAVTYHWSESWGFGLSFAAAQTKDREERACVESFYNDPDHEAGAPCYSQDGGAGLEGAKSANIGPAYPRIRELRALFGVFGDYTIAYGKQILLHGAVSHFDLRLRFGAAAVVSDVYAERQTVRGDPSRPARGDPTGANGAPKAGVAPDERDGDGLLWGKEGRPEPRRETAPAAFLALAEQLHFARRFFLTGELGAYAMPSPARGFEAFLVVGLGGGVRF
jgi:hypothetical protein